MPAKRGIFAWEFPWVRWVLLGSMLNCAFVLAFAMEWGVVPVMLLSWVTAEMQFRLSKGRLPRIWVYMSILGYGLAALVLRKADLQDWSLQDGPVNYEYILKAALVLGITQASSFYRCIPQGIAWAVLTTLAWRYGTWLPVYIATHLTFGFEDLLGFDIFWNIIVFILVLGPIILILLGIIPSLLTGGILSWLGCKQQPVPQVDSTEERMNWTEKVSADVRMRFERLSHIIASLLPNTKIEKGRWILFSALGVGIAAGTSMVAATKIESMGALSWSIVFFGVGIGLLQWIVLRRVIDLGWWVVTTALGAAPALVIVMNVRNVLSEAMPQEMPDFSVWAIFIVTIGLVFAVGVAAMQWLALRERFETTNSWLGINVVAWWIGSVGGTAAALAISCLVQRYVEFLAASKQVSSIAAAAWPAATGGAIAGAIAGAISWRALRDVLPRVDSTDQETTGRV